MERPYFSDSTAVSQPFRCLRLALHTSSAAFPRGESSLGFSETELYPHFHTTWPLCAFSVIILPLQHNALNACAVVRAVECCTRQKGVESSGELYGEVYRRFSEKSLYPPKALGGGGGGDAGRGNLKDLWYLYRNSWLSQDQFSLLFSYYWNWVIYKKKRSLFLGSCFLEVQDYVVISVKTLWCFITRWKLEAKTMYIYMKKLRQITVIVKQFLW